MGEDQEEVAAGLVRVADLLVEGAVEQSVVHSELVQFAFAQRREVNEVRQRQSHDVVVILMIRNLDH